MKFSASALVGIVSLVQQCTAASLPARAAAGVSGKAFGFASGTTGGGSATPVYPANINELTSYLTDSSPRVIILNKEFNYIGSEGRVTETGCRPASNKCVGKGQDAINGANWCNNGNAGAGSFAVQVSYDKAGIAGINVQSNKSIIGEGSKGVIRGKGLRIANGAKNVIIQNIHITELNPQYIWGGDALTLAGTDLVWIDHVKVSLIGRQMFVAGESASGRVTISNSEFDGNTSWSATCDDHHYWGLYMTGSSDLITLSGNYIHHTSGRSPKVGGNTLLHAVNNYWYANSGHAFDAGSSNAMILAEGNVFQNVVTPLLSPKVGQVFSSPSTSANQQCSAYIGHNCALNAFGSSGAFSSSDTGFFKNFQGKSIAGVQSLNGAQISAAAGVGKV